jgi:hypothetical protein
MCFQGACWKGMRDMWRLAVPMMECWRVLVPLKMAVDFEDVLNSLENLVGRPEPIAYPPLPDLDGEQMTGALGRQQSRVEQLEPP